MLYPSPSHADDLVVLLADDGTPTGTAPRRAVHGPDTPLHLAFSTYLIDDAGRLLLTRRALGKATWPGVWSNSCCGHPRPGEDVAAAAVRRVAEELGSAPADLRLALPRFRYRAVDAGGTVEHELCPVYVGRIDTVRLRPDPAEVAEAAWVPWANVVAAAAAAPRLLSPWAVRQIAELAELGALGTFGTPAEIGTLGTPAEIGALGTPAERPGVRPEGGAA